MKNKQFFIFFVTFMIFLLSVNFVYGKSSYIFKNYETFDLKVPIYNNDKSPASSDMTCSITISNPQMNAIVYNQEMTYNTGGIYNITVEGSLVNYTGSYYSSLSCCNTTGGCGFSTFSISITPTGTILSTAEGMVYILSLLGTLIMFFVFAYFGITIKWAHLVDNSGKIIGVNDLRHLKLLFIVFAYGSLMITFSLLSSICYNYLVASNLGDIFYWVYYVMLVLTFPIVAVAFFVFWIIFFKNIEEKKLLERGLIRR